MSDRAEKGRATLPGKTGQPAAAGLRIRGELLLSVKDMHVRFGGIKAVDGLSFDVHEGELISVIGPTVRRRAA